MTLLIRTRCAVLYDLVRVEGGQEELIHSSPHEGLIRDLYAELSQGRRWTVAEYQAALAALGQGLAEEAFREMREERERRFWRTLRAWCRRRRAA